MSKNTKIPKVVSNNKKKIEPNYIPEEDVWNWQKFLIPELYSSISDLLAVREVRRFQFYEDLKKFIKTWKKGTKEEMIKMYSQRLNTLKINLTNKIDLINDDEYNKEIVLITKFLKNLKKL